MKKYLSALQNRLSDEQKDMLKQIYAPRVVGTPLSDSRRDVCVLPDGEIRAYGAVGRDKRTGEAGVWSYLSSYDCGLSWQMHYATGKVHSCTYFEDANIYIGIDKDAPNEDGAYVFRSKIGPDDQDPERIKVCDGPISTICSFLPIKSDFSNRIWFTTERSNPSKSVVFCYSDDYGVTWTTRELPTPENHAVTFPDKGLRWCKGNNTEPYVTELSEKHLFMMIRTAFDQFYVSHSYDNGDSWSAPAPSSFYGTNTTAFLLRLADGRVINFWNNTNALPIPLADSNGHGEVAFNNRDAAHAAITENGIDYIGYREILLNPIRERNDFRYFGGDFGTMDKSVHQFQAFELPYNKVLVSVGQNTASSRLMIFDIDWLYETEREYCSFKDGTAPLSAHTYTKSVYGSYFKAKDVGNGHCSYNRTHSALMVPNPEDPRYEVLSIAPLIDKRLISNIGGAVWNFPLSKKGRVSLEIKILEDAASISLSDRWYNPCDAYAPPRSQFHFQLDADRIGTDFCVVDIDYDTDSGKAVVHKGDTVLMETTMQTACETGMCYLIMQSVGDVSEGYLIRSIKKRNI